MFDDAKQKKEQAVVLALLLIEEALTILDSVSWNDENFGRYFTNHLRTVYLNNLLDTPLNLSVSVTSGRETLEKAFEQVIQTEILNPKKKGSSRASAIKSLLNRFFKFFKDLVKRII